MSALGSPRAYCGRKSQRGTWIAVAVRRVPLVSIAVILAIQLANAAADMAIAVQDDTGKTVNLPHAAQRIVSLSPHVTELIFDVGGFGQVVGVSDYSDYPVVAVPLTHVGGASGLDLERIASLKPDLVVGWASGNSEAQLDAIERLGIPVYRSEPETLEQVAWSLERLGRLTGHAAQGVRAAHAFRARAEEITRQYATRPSVRVFYQVWDAPLMTLGRRHLISEVIRMCGGANVFSTIDALTATVDREAVVTADPQVIVAARGDAPSADELGPWRKWPSIAAVRNHLLVTIDPAILTRATPRILDGAEQLCRSIERARHTPQSVQSEPAQH